MRLRRRNETNIPTANDENVPCEWLEERNAPSNTRLETRLRKDCSRVLHF
jgi:hypothetical protein